MEKAFRVWTAVSVRDADDEKAVVLELGDRPSAFSMSIATAREVSNELARAADEAELKLDRSPS